MLLVWLIPLLFWLFLLGAAVGSFLNVCIARLAARKSLLWPGSRCGACQAEVRARDNIPLVSYWVLRGRCRDCGVTFSVRYFLIELFTALTFVALYLLEIGVNIHGIPAWDRSGLSFLEWGQFAPHSWSLYAWHAAFASLLIATVGARLEFGHVPHGLLVFGILCGLLGATLFPWPTPSDPRQALGDTPIASPYSPADGPLETPRRGLMPRERSWAHWPVAPRPGFVPWPVWGPLPEFLPPGSPLLGLLTGFSGLLVATWLPILAEWLRKRGRGHDLALAPDTEVVRLAGPFLGWQPICVILLLGTLLTLAVQALARWWGTEVRSSTPGFALGVVVTWWGWGWMGPWLAPILFDPLMCLLLTGALLCQVYLFARFRRLHAPLVAPAASD